MSVPVEASRLHGPWGTSEAQFERMAIVDEPFWLLQCQLFLDLELKFSYCVALNQVETAALLHQQSRVSTPQRQKVATMALLISQLPPGAVELLEIELQCVDPCLGDPGG
jgi:hypothetical protein